MRLFSEINTSDADAHIQKHTKTVPHHFYSWICGTPEYSILQSLLGALNFTFSFADTGW